MGKFSDILLTVDYDRTLTAPDSSIPQANLDAIRYFIAEGGAFTVNTGRSLPMTADLRKTVPLNAPLLLYNGSAAYDTAEDRVTFCHEIDLPLHETIAKVMALVPDLTVEVQSLDAHYRFAPNDDWDAFYEFNHCAHAAATPDMDLGPFLKFTVYSWEGRGTVGHLFEADEETLRRMDEAEALLREALQDHCVVHRSGARILDIHAKGTSKAKSARELQQALGKKHLVCIGDALNDLAMLEEADFAYVPSDAFLADRFENLCPCAEGAVADAIYNKIPNLLSF